MATGDKAHTPFFCPLNSECCGVIRPVRSVFTHSWKSACYVLVSYLVHPSLCASVHSSDSFSLRTAKDVVMKFDVDNVHPHFISFFIKSSYSHAYPLILFIRELEFRIYAWKNTKFAILRNCAIFTGFIIFHLKWWVVDLLKNTVAEEGVPMMCVLRCVSRILEVHRGSSREDEALHRRPVGICALLLMRWPKGLLTVAMYPMIAVFHLPVGCATGIYFQPVFKLIYFVWVMRDFCWHVVCVRITER